MIRLRGKYVTYFFIFLNKKNYENSTIKYTN